MCQKLSEVPGLGHVALCGNCEDVHVTVGRMSFRLPRGAFMELARLIGEASGHALLGGGREPRYSVFFEDGVPRIHLA